MEEGHTVHDTFMEYKPAKLGYGVPHPDAVVETASLAAVEPPDITYTLAAHTELVEEGRLSALQLEAVVYACQRHEQRLPSGARGGFFIGDGAGVGKGRTIAGLMLENWRKGRKRHLWVSVGSDLKVDAERDLNDVGAVGENGIPLHALNKLPYGKLDGRKIDVREGIVFLTYSALVSASAGRSRMTRFKQLKEWCGPDFDGLIVFDESHKAKNLVPEAGNKATQVGMKVQDLQNELPNARIVYCSATGASEPRNMGYMVRLGLWGEGHAGFPNFSRFLDAIQGKGGAAAGNMAALELVAMDMKAQGMYVCRTLSFAGAEFQSLEVPLEEPVAGQYHAAADMWNKLFREFMKAEELAQEVEENLGGKAGGDGGGASEATSAATSAATSGRQRKSGFGSAGSMTWRAFWAAHQRFFRHMCMAAKVPAVVRMAIEALEQDKCVVIGLQSTGEARTAEVVKKKRDEAMRRKMKEELELKDEAVKEEKSEGVKDEVGEENPEEVKDEKVEEVVEDVVEELDDFVSGPKELLTQLVDKYYPMPPYREGAGYGSDSDSDDDDATFQNKGITGAAANGSLGTRGVSKRARSQVRYKEYGSEGELQL